MKKITLIVITLVILILTGGCSQQSLDDEKYNFKSVKPINTNEKYRLIEEQIKQASLWINSKREFLGHKDISRIIELVNNSEIYKDSDVESADSNGIGSDVVLDLKDLDDAILLNDLIDDNFVLLTEYPKQNKYLIKNRELNEYLDNLRNRPNINFNNIKSIKIINFNNEEVVINAASVLTYLEEQLNKSINVIGSGCPFENKVIINTDKVKIEGRLSSDGDAILKIDKNNYLSLAITKHTYDLFNQKIKIVR